MSLRIGGTGVPYPASAVSGQHEGFVPMYVEAVTVCVGFADVLRETLPWNVQQVDRLVVVTSFEDEETQKLCTYHGVSCLTTDVFTEDADAFNKGRAINLGLSHLRHRGYLLHMDADIALPDRFRNRLADARLQEDSIYGSDRVNATWDQWQKFKKSDDPQWRYHYLLCSPPGSIGARLVHYDHGYVPIGFFQLWHASAKRVYPIIAGGADHSDVMFGVQWPRSKRHLLPEIVCLHLVGEGSTFGVNWRGRVSPRFGPKKKKNS